MTQIIPAAKTSSAVTCQLFYVGQFRLILFAFDHKFADSISEKKMKQKKEKKFHSTHNTSRTTIEEKKYKNLSGFIGISSPLFFFSFGTWRDDEM